MPSEFETLMIKMDEGFDKVYGKVDDVREKIDDLRDDHVRHMPICKDKFAEIDKKLAVKDAVNEERKVQEAEKRDWGKWFMRLTVGTIAIGALALLWQLLTGGARIIAN